MERQTDYVLDAVHLGESGIAVCLTEWINLGAGLHPTDTKWRSHIRKFMSQGVINTPHVSGSIRSNFESHTNLKLQEFTAMNRHNPSSPRKFWPLTFRPDRYVGKVIGGAPHQWCLENAQEEFGWHLAFINNVLS